MIFLAQYHIIIIGCVFLTILMAMTWLTHREKKWVKKRYKKENIIALGFGIICYGLSSDKKAPKKHKGFLLVHKGGVLFKSRFSEKQFNIPGESIQKVYHDDIHKGARLYQSAVMVDFLPFGQDKDTIAFKLAYPPQWIKIIGKAFIK